MAWKASVPWLGGGAALAAGLVWARSVFKSRTELPRPIQDAPPQGVTAEEDAPTIEVQEAQRAARARRAADSLPELDPDFDLDFEEIARADALHDMGDFERPLDLDADTEREPSGVDAFDAATTVGPFEHFDAGDEPYDALEPEDVGAAWIRRATQSDLVGHVDATEALEGTHTVFEGDPATSTYGESRGPESGIDSSRELAALTAEQASATVANARRRSPS